MLGSAMSLLDNPSTDYSPDDPAYSPPNGNETVLPATGYPISVTPQELQQENTGQTNGPWWGATANTDYITPSVGGEPGKSPALGWSTGLSIRRMFQSPITGRTLIPPSTNVLPQAQGPVGLKNFDVFLANGVQSQTAELPSLQQIAQSFLRPLSVMGQ